MEVLKIFPSLLLELISKIIPGSLFLWMFRERYQPLTETVLKTLEPPPLPPEWRSWSAVGMALVTAYVIGIFIALGANALDAVLIRRRWFPAIKRDPGEYVHAADLPLRFHENLASGTKFLLFIGHCRSYVEVNSPSSAIKLERYRTAYRLFFGLTFLFIAIPLQLRTVETAATALLFPVFAWLTYLMQKRYLLQSIQCFSLAMAAAGARAPARGASD